MLTLNDLLKLTDEEISVTKIRLNRKSGKINPINIYKQNPNELLNWNYYSNKTYKEGQISIGLVELEDNDSWLLFTIGRITKVLDIPINGIQVEFETLKQYEDLFGRTVVSYHNNSQNMFRNAGTEDKLGVKFIDKLVIKEILPTMYTGFQFPGYDQVSLSFAELSVISKGHYHDYKSALENQKAVYLLTDKSTGKCYVGSATAKSGMLFSRWSAYVKNGHGGNKGLKNLVDDKGFDYIKDNFQYTIIENFNSKVDDKYVLGRESYWKEVLQSRAYGYNEN